MRLRNLFFFFTVLMTGSFLLNTASAMQPHDERHIKVALRQVGHDLLLRSGDRVSRVLAVEKQGNTYQVQFESSFSFDPGGLALSTDSIFKKSGMTGRYLVEMKECVTRKVVHSYEMGAGLGPDQVACSGRVQPRGCYMLFFTLMDGGPVVHAQAGLADSASQPSLKGSRWGNATLLLGMMGLIFLYLYNNRKKKGDEEEAVQEEHLLFIGAYRFDTRNMTLSFEEEVTELTSKEADLLLLLYNSANETVERDVILNSVWGDEGDYVGRTLDVFISKLRKKLESDPGLKIVNVRGVGYKLVVN